MEGGAAGMRWGADWPEMVWAAQSALTGVGLGRVWLEWAASGARAAATPLLQGSTSRVGTPDCRKDALAPPQLPMLEFAQKYFRDPQKRPQ